MNKQREYRTALQELRVKPESGNTLTGYIAVFNTRSEDLGGFREQLATGCFTSSMGNDVRALVNHSSSACVGRTKSGTLRLIQDDKGLQFEVDLPDTTAARDLKVSVERGDVTGCSFGFFCLDDEIDCSTTPITRTVKDVELFEVSVGVTFPAYESTSAQLRSLFPDGVPTFQAPERRLVDPDHANVSGCRCECNNCTAGDCQSCTDPDCVEDNCLANVARSMRDRLVVAEAALAI